MAKKKVSVKLKSIQQGNNPPIKVSRPTPEDCEKQREKVRKLGEEIQASMAEFGKQLKLLTEMELP